MYKLLEVGKKKYVLCSNIRKTESYIKQKNGVSLKVFTPMANFNNTGMALCGILKGGQTLEQFIKIKEFKENRLKKM